MGARKVAARFWRWARTPLVSPLVIAAAWLLGEVIRRAVLTWGAAAVSRACFIGAGVAFVCAVTTLAVALHQRRTR